MNRPHPKPRRRIPARPRSARTRTHRPFHPQSRVQPRPRLLHRAIQSPGRTKPRRLPTPPDPQKTPNASSPRTQNLRRQSPDRARAGIGMENACLKPSSKTFRSTFLSFKVAKAAALDVLSHLRHRRRTRLRSPRVRRLSVIHIENGRHPVVEQQVRHFTANHTRLDHKHRLMLLTGPNMGGKSTYMRQVAHIVLMAHTGSFVPADAAQIGPIDQIFTRIGASDDLASTAPPSWSKWAETAYILHHATDQSLVLMDEVGPRYFDF